MKQMLELPDEALLQLLANHSQRAGPTGRRFARRMVSALPYAAFALAIAVALSRDPSADPRLRSILAFLGVGMGVVALLTAGYALRATRLQSHCRGKNFRASKPLPFAMVLLLAGRTDRRFLPYLLSEIDTEFMLFERTRAETDLIPPTLPLASAVGATAVYKLASPHALNQIRHRYRRLLKGMLSQIEAEEMLELSAEQRHALLLLLQIPEEDVDLTVCILARLEQWGDARTIPVLKRLIREEHWYVGSDRIEAAARQCLERVETHLQRQKQRNTLLRPTEGADATPPLALLRPAADAPEQAPEQLLRPDISRPPHDSP